MEFTKEQLKDYMAGRLKLVTKTSTGTCRLVRATKRPYDKGVTKPAKRAYYRVWYMKRRAELIVKKRKAYLARKRVAVAAKRDMVAGMTRKEYMRRWHLKNRAHKMPLLRKDRPAPVKAAAPKRTWWQRLLGRGFAWSLDA